MSTEDTVLRYLREGNLIAFIGAGVSRSVKDPFGNILYEGLPDARGLVQAMHERDAEIAPDMPLEDAAFQFRKAVGDREYRAFFEAKLDPPDFIPLPAHRCLALLPFTAYVSMNFDMLLERALDQARQEFHAVVKERDFYASNLLRRRLVLKPHGCISDFETVVLSTDEVAPYSERAPFIDALLRVLLTNTPALFIGFGLKDADFRILIQTIKKSVKSLPRSFAITLRSTRFERQFWAEHDIELIDSDLTAFLTTLANKVTGEDFPIHLRKVDFLDDPMFSQISSSRVRALPSETQVIEALLDGLATRLLEPKTDFTAIVDDARIVIDKIIVARPNYSAFARATGEVLQALDAVKSTGGDSGDAFNALTEIRRRRESISDRIRANGRSVVTKNDKILLYSQSVRVVELLLSFPPFVQDSCQIYISECRPKSPRIFFDAAHFAEALLPSRYHIRFVPDVTTTTLIATQKVTKVLLGAHAVFVDDTGLFNGFVNTCGSLQLVLACEKFGIPVFVIAEHEKVERIVGDAAKYSQEQEERLEIPSNIGLPPTVFRQLSKVPVLNIGYDYVPAQPHVTLISD